MAQYLGTVELGALYKQGTPLVRPAKPWRNDSDFGGGGNGNIPNMEGTINNYTLGNTPSAGDKKLKWHKIKDGNKTLLICDRNILANVSWDDLNSQSYVFGKNVTIDGITYKARLLTGGNYYRSGTDSYSGGEPSNNEWDRFITNEDNISGLTKPNSTDLDNSINSTDRTGTHNQKWNWGYCYSWCQETYRDNASYRSIRGYSSARYYIYGASSGRRSYCGWRPVLEILNTAPLISDSDRNLGDKVSDFDISYTVDDPDASDTLTVVEQIDSNNIRTIHSAVRNQTYVIQVDVNKLSLSNHTIKIMANDGKGGSATRTFTFKKSNSAPTISGSDENVGIVKNPFSRTYSVTDNENNAVTITEKINEEVIRTFQGTLGKEETITLSEESLRKLKNGNHVLKVEAKDDKGATSIRSFTFEKADKDIIVELKAIETDRAVTKINVTPFLKMEGANIKIEVCNNAFDASQTWENITSEALINKVYKIKNTEKTSEKWGLSIRFTIKKWEGYDGEINLTGFGGAYE